MYSLKRFGGRNRHRMFSSHIPQCLGSLASSLYDKSGDIVDVMSATLVQVHDVSGLPWWATILSSTVAARITISLGPAVLQQRTISRRELLIPQIREWNEALKHNITSKSRREGVSSKVNQNRLELAIKAKQKELFSTNNCQTWKSTSTLWGQIPMWLSLSFAYRNVFSASGVDAPTTMEGLAWFGDLSAPDPLFILPVAVGVAHLANLELNTFSRGNFKPSKRAELLKTALTSLSILIVPVAIQLPSGLVFYWTTSAWYALIQNYMLLFPSVRRFFDIPKSPSEMERPFAQLKTASRLWLSDFIADVKRGGRVKEKGG